MRSLERKSCRRSLFSYRKSMSMLYLHFHAKSLDDVALDDEALDDVPLLRLLLLPCVSFSHS